MTDRPQVDAIELAELIGPARRQRLAVTSGPVPSPGMTAILMGFATTYSFSLG